MKTVPLLSALALSSVAAFADPNRPIGTIDVDNVYVRTGTKPLVSWEITYPPGVRDLVVPLPTGRVITTEETRVKMRVAGVAFQSGSTHLPVEFSAKVGGGWQELFFGTGAEVRPSEYVFDQVVPAGTTLDFRGQAQRENGGFYDPRWTDGVDLGVTGLFDGDTPPYYAPAYEQGNIESFLSSYISEENTIQIGPRDMIYLFELASHDPSEWWFDMQDLVVVVTYEQTTTAP